LKAEKDSLEISVVIPAYNAESYIKKAVESTLRQAYKPKEIIVVDDGSTDQTAEIVNSLADSINLKIKLIQSQRGGVSKARNIGFMAAQTQYVAMLDADDYYSDSFFDLASLAFQVYPDVVAFFGDQYYINENNETIGTTLSGKSVEKIDFVEKMSGIRKIHHGVFGSLLDGSYISSSGVIVKRDKAMEAGLFDSELIAGEDQDFFCRLSLTGPLSYTREKVGYVLRHSQNATHPRNLVNVQINHRKTLLKLAVIAEEKKLCSQDIARCKRNIKDIEYNLIYILSRQGVWDYLGSLSRLGFLIVPTFLSPKSWVRAIYYSIFRK